MRNFKFWFAVLLLIRGAFAAEREIVDKNLLQQQKSILDLLQRVYQPNVEPEITEIADSYKIEENIVNYRVPVAATNFLKLYKRGLLPRDEVFSILNDKQRKEVVALFELFFFAKDFDSFFKTACWARVNINPGQFVYALTAALNHREDMRHIVLPPIYEINPHFFVDADIMQKAAEMFMNKEEISEDILVTPEVTVNPNVKPESRLRYFTEDVSLNTYNNYYHLSNPFWMNITDGKRGELFWYYHQQLFARYLQERYSNDLSNFEPFMINEVISEGYNPRLRYPNGKYFAIRSDNIKLDSSNGHEIKLFEDYERRIRDAIDLGFVIGENGEMITIDDRNGIDLLGHLIQPTMKSTNRKYYGNFYQLVMQLLGRIVDPRRSQNIPPGILEHFETALRDPLYYRVLGTINQIFNRYKIHLPNYSRKYLEFPGVQIDSIEVEKLNTFFENFDFDVSNAILTKKLDNDHPINVRHYRLNHQPFSYFVNITAERPSTAMVRTFLGLNRDIEGRLLDINEKRKFMVQIDNFPIELHTGLNTIERKSSEITITRKKHSTMKQLYNEVNNALEGNGKYLIVENQECGYPGHLLLPKGKAEGMPYSFFVVISSYNPKEFENGRYGCGNGRGLFYEDQFPMGYPFDRIVDEEEFNVSNFREKEVFIYHKSTQQIS